MDLSVLEEQGLIQEYEDFYMLKDMLIDKYVEEQIEHIERYGKLNFSIFIEHQEEYWYLNSFRPYLYWGNPKQTLRD
jgi:hypothetical protein